MNFVPLASVCMRATLPNRSCSPPLCSFAEDIAWCVAKQSDSDSDSDTHTNSESDNELGFALYWGDFVDQPHANITLKLAFHQLGNRHLVFTDAKLDSTRRWCLPLATLNMFIDNMTVPDYPVITMPAFPKVRHTSVRPTEATKCCLFCDSPVSLRHMRNHLQKNGDGG